MQAAGVGFQPADDITLDVLKNLKNGENHMVTLSIHGEDGSPVEYIASREGGVIQLHDIDTDKIVATISVRALKGW